MPIAIETHETHEKTWKVSWEFEADLRLESKPCAESDVLDLGFLGDWRLRVDYADRHLHLILDWDHSVVRSVSESGMRFTTRLDALVGPHKNANLIHKGSNEQATGAWPAFMYSWFRLLCVRDATLQSAASKLSLDLATHRSWRLSVELKASSTAVAVAPRVMLPASFVESLRAPPTTVRLYFPNTDLELWTTEQTLTNASPYFATLFASGFAESIGTHSKRRRTEGGAPTATAAVEGELEFEDSDDEADEIYVEEKRPAADPGDMVYREVSITSATYSTYAALLLWLSSGNVDFAPLRSRYRFGNWVEEEEKSSSRKDDLFGFYKAHPNRAIPSSPKSLFRLAHFLDMPTLKALALASYKSMLSNNFVAAELVCDVLGAYEELRAAAVDFVAKGDWGQVRKSAAMQQVLKDIDGDDSMKLRYAGVVSELMKKGVI